MNNFEEKQLKRLQKEQNQPKRKNYLFIFMVVIVLMRIVNELSSNISTYIQSAIVNEFFLKDGISYEAALAKYTSMNMIVSGFVLLTMFYKPLADKLGRKAVMIINLFGIMIGMILAYLSPVAFVYLFGVALYSFFTQNDVQMVYILESAPKNKGASLFATVKSIGILGLVFVPLLRDLLLNNDMTRWRELYLGPILLCVVIIIGFFLFMKESDVFIENRIHNILHKEQFVSNEENHDSGLKESIKYILKNKQLRVSVLAYVFYGICSMAAYMYVESIMTTNGLSSEDITKAMYVYPFVYATLCFIAGPIADKLGRKVVVVTTGFFVAIGFCLFIFGCSHHWNPYLIGFIEGIYLGGYWVCGDYISVLFLEEVPTELRTSVISGSSLLMMGGCVLGLAIQMILMITKGLNVASLIVIVPCILICTFIILFKVKETKGTDLKKVKREVY